MSISPIHTEHKTYKRTVEVQRLRAKACSEWVVKLKHTFHLWSRLKACLYKSGALVLSRLLLLLQALQRF